MSMKGLIRFLPFAVLWAASPASSQETGRNTVISFNVSGMTRLEAVLRLAKQQREPLAIEYVGPAAFESVTVDLRSMDFQAAMEALWPAQDGFQTEIEEGVLTLSHRDVPRPNILDTRLRSFSVGRVALGEASARLSSVLHEELLKSNEIIFEYPSGPPGAFVGPLQMEDVLVRDALNRIVRGQQAAWIVQLAPSKLLGRDAKTGEPLWREGEAFWYTVEYDNDKHLEAVVKATRKNAGGTLPRRPAPASR